MFLEFCNFTGQADKMTFKPTVIVIEPVILKCHLTKDIVEHNNEQIYYFWQKIPVERQ
jgi:hypothetical protein